jgi:hypothetical protein
MGTGQKEGRKKKKKMVFALGAIGSENNDENSKLRYHAFGSSHWFVYTTTRFTEEAQLLQHISFFFLYKYCSKNNFASVNICRFPCYWRHTQKLTYDLMGTVHYCGPTLAKLRTRQNFHKNCPIKI